MRKVFFLGGLVSGFALAANWRTVAKQSIKFGIRAGKKIGEISQVAREELEDVAAEVNEELSPKPQPDREVEN